MTIACGMSWAIAMAMALTVAWLCLAGRAQGTVSCRTACAQCTARTEHQALLEVYCAMCHECRERRRAWNHFAPRRRKSTASLQRPSHRVNSADEFPDESPDGPPQESPEGPPEDPRCPEPPPCDSEFLEGTPDRLMPTTPERQPTTAPPVPQVPALPPVGAAPCCMPMCPYAQPYAQPCPNEYLPQKMTLPEKSTAAPTEYFYIHVGVPKDILNNM